MRPRLAALAALLALLLLPAAQALPSGGGYSHPYPEGVQPGDIVFGHGEKTDWLIPGYWTHTGIVAYYDASLGDWVVVEANPGTGVSLTTLSEFLSRYDAVALARVDAPEWVREAAVDFALSRLGYSYDYWWPFKQVYGSGYYCSELVWAAYMAAGGVDLDANPGWSWTYLYGVAPQEVYDDGDTIVYYLHYAG